MKKAGVEQELISALKAFRELCVKANDIPEEEREPAKDLTAVLELWPKSTKSDAVKGKKLLEEKIEILNSSTEFGKLRNVVKEKEAEIMQLVKDHGIGAFCLDLGDNIVAISHDIDSVGDVDLLENFGDGDGGGPYLRFCDTTSGVLLRYAKAEEPQSHAKARKPPPKRSPD